MGLLSAIAGPLVGAVASGILGGRERKQRKSDAKAKFTDLRASAEKAGFNPLTALMATGGQGFGDYGASIPPLATSNFLSSAASSVAKEMTGEAAVQRATDRANQEMAELALEQMRSGVAGVSGLQNPLRVANPTKMYVGGTSQPVQPRLRNGPETPAMPTEPSMTMGPSWETAEKEPMRGVPLTAEYRTGNKDNPSSYRGLNNDAWETGVSEIVGGAMIHGFGWGLHQLTRDRSPEKDMQVNQDFWLPPLSTGPLRKPQT